MFLIVVTFICAMAISTVAIYYSVLGLAAIFAAAKLPIIIMGGVLEVSKLVTASWLYQNWRNIPFFLKTYLTIAVVILMLITSLGIFGFLSRAHIEQATPTGDAVAKIERINSQIARQESTIESLIGKIDRLRTGTSDTASVQIDREQNIINNANNNIEKDLYNNFDEIEDFSLNSNWVKPTNEEIKFLNHREKADPSSSSKDN